MQRKLLTVITEKALERPLTRLVLEKGARGYTITEAYGAGKRAPRMGDLENAVNIRMEVICEDSVARAIAAKLHDDYFTDFAMVLYLCDVEVLRPEKFAAGGG